MVIRVSASDTVRSPPVSAMVSSVRLPAVLKVRLSTPKVAPPSWISSRAIGFPEEFTVSWVLAGAPSGNIACPTGKPPTS
ncbi:hypothetical protein D3C73_961390 [compost metagenome]